GHTEQLALSNAVSNRPRLDITVKPMCEPIGTLKQYQKMRTMFSWISEPGKTRCARRFGPESPTEKIESQAVSLDSDFLLKSQSGLHMSNAWKPRSTDRVNLIVKNCYVCNDNACHTHLYRIPTPNRLMTTLRPYSLLFPDTKITDHDDSRFNSRQFPTALPKHRIKTAYRNSASSNSPIRHCTNAPMGEALYDWCKQTVATPLRAHNTVCTELRKTRQTWSVCPPSYRRNALTSTSVSLPIAGDGKDETDTKENKPESWNNSLPLWSYESIRKNALRRSDLLAVLNKLSQSMPYVPKITPLVLYRFNQEERSSDDHLNDRITPLSFIFEGRNDKHKNGRTNGERTAGSTVLLLLIPHKHSVPIRDYAIFHHRCSEIQDEWVRLYTKRSGSMLHRNCIPLINAQGNILSVGTSHRFERSKATKSTIIKYAARTVTLDTNHFFLSVHALTLDLDRKAEIPNSHTNCRIVNHIAPHSQIDINENVVRVIWLAHWSISKDQRISRIRIRNVRHVRIYLAPWLDKIDVRKVRWVAGDSVCLGNPSRQLSIDF
ncbi:hypothetical protein CLF_105879, partial [Clonorchis sinensis]